MVKGYLSISINKVWKTMVIGYCQKMIKLECSQSFDEYHHGIEFVLLAYTEMMVNCYALSAESQRHKIFKVLRLLNLYSINLLTDEVMMYSWGN